MFRKLRLFNMFSSLFRANFQNATHLIGVALSAFHRIPNPLQCLGQGCARAGDVDPLEAATAVSEDLAAVEPQLRLVDDQVFQFVDRKPRPAEIKPYKVRSFQVDHLHARKLFRVHNSAFSNSKRYISGSVSRRIKSSFAVLTWVIF